MWQVGQWYEGHIVLQESVEIMKKHLHFLFLLALFPSLAFSQDKSWVTEKDVIGGTVLRLHWTHVHEGFDSVFKIEAHEDGVVTKTFDIYGQPVFNEDNSVVAFPDCWHGGCELEINLLDLKQLQQLQPIQLEREAFLECSWEESMLRVVLGGMYPGQKDEIRYFEVTSTPGT